MVTIKDVNTLRFTNVWNEKEHVCIGLTFESEDDRSKYDYHHGLLMDVEYAEDLVKNIQKTIKEIKKEAK